MLLKTTSEVLRIDLAGAADPEMCTLISYVDRNRCNGAEKAGSQDGQSTDTDAVAILAAPGADTDRLIKQITVFNRDNAAATITIEIYDGTSAYTLFRAAFVTGGESIQWSPTTGWCTLNSAGALQMTAYA